MNTIWIVDDSPGSNALLKFAIQELHPTADILCFQSGREVLATLSQHGVPDALFMDVHMGELSGIDTLSLLVRRGEKPAWVCLCSSDSDPDLPIQADQVGADSFFVKPWGYDALLKILQGLLTA